MKRTIAFVTSYPPEGTTHDRKIVGGASYTKTLLEAIAKFDQSHDLTVYGEVFEKPDTYDEAGVTIKRIWQKNNLPSLFAAFKDIWKSVSVISVSFEIQMMGSALNTLFLFFLLFVSRIRGKKIIFIPHQVVGNFDNLEKNLLKKSLLNLSVWVFNRMISAVSDKVVVFEKALSTRIGNSTKITYIPLAVEERTIGNPQKARENLDLDDLEFYILNFGFLSPYKGLDQLIDIFTPTSTDKLLVAGDANPNHLSNHSYQVFVKNVKQKALEKKIIMKGFIDETEINDYFSASDIIILPYRIFFSSSYPMSLAFTFEKPVLLSSALSPYFEDPDFQEALHFSKLKQSDFIFEQTKNSLSEKIEFIKKNKKKFVTFAKFMKGKRNIKKIANKYIKLFDEI